MKTRSTYVMALLTAILVPLQAYAFTKALPWSNAASMIGARYYHTATTLANGKVLVVGGRNATTAALKTVEVYDTTTNKWTAGTALAVARKNHTATLVTVSGNERVLITGGSDETNASLNTALLCTDVGVCSPAAENMAKERAKHTATLLSGGKVLVAGGVAAGLPLNTAEIYDPAGDAITTWTDAGNLAGARYDHAAVLVGTTVYVTGGLGISGANIVVLNTVETHPGTGTTWTAGVAMGTARTRHTATVFNTDDILVAGGFNGTAYLNTAEVFTNSWAATSSTMVKAHAEHSAIKLNDNKVLIIGGTSTGTDTISNVDSYDPDTAGTTWTWSLTGTGALATARKNAAAALITGGKVLITGGASGTVAMDTTELYDPNITAPIATTVDSGTIGLNSVNSVTLSMKGSIQSKGANTAASFDQSTSSPIPADIAASANVIAVPGTVAATTVADTPIVGTKSGLLCGTDYFYRAKAVSVVGTSRGATSTPAKKLLCAPPKITNGAVNAITKTTATLNAKVAGLGAAIKAGSLKYNCSTTDTTPAAEGASSSCKIAETTAQAVSTPTIYPAATAGDTAMTAKLVNLTCDRLYSYKFSATNEAGGTDIGTTAGAEANFTTSACTTVANLSVDLSSALTATPGTPIASVAAGANVTYTAVVTNPAKTIVAGVEADSATAGGAKFKSPAATGVTISSVTCSASGSAACPTVPAPTVANLQGSAGLVIPTLPAGGSVTFTMTGTVAANASGFITKTANIAAPTGVIDPVTTNNSVTDIDRVTTAKANLTVESITLTPVSPVEGTTFTAKVAVKNAAGGLPAGRFYVDFWKHEATPTVRDCNLTTSDAWASVPNLAAGASATVTLTGLTAGVAGAKTARAFVDSWCEVTESTANDAVGLAADQGINQKTKTYTVTTAIAATIAVSPATVAEAGGNLVYTITLSEAPTASTTVNLVTSGTATPGTDYTGNVATVTFPAGIATRTVTIDPTVDTATETGGETVIITIVTGTGYTVGGTAAATGTIIDVPTASIAVSPASTTETGANLVYTVTLDVASTAATTVSLATTGTATANTDYTGAAPTSVVIAAGNTTNTVEIDPLQDGDTTDKTVIITITSGTGYTVGSPSAATGTITNI